MGFGYTLAKGLISGTVSIYDGNEQIFKGGRWFIDSYNMRDPTCKNIRWVIPKRIKYVIIIQRLSAIDMSPIYYSQWIKNNCILITGDGFPTLLCQRLIKSLYTQMREEKRYLPMYCLVDYAPKGINIFLTHQQGKANKPETYLYAIPNLLYLGLEYEDIIKYKLQHITSVMSNKDYQEVKLLESFLEKKKTMYFKISNKTVSPIEHLVFGRLCKQIQMLKTYKRKMKMDCIVAICEKYLPQKIRDMDEIYKLNNSKMNYMNRITSNNE